MPDKDSKTGQRASNIARFDARRARVREDKPCVSPTNPYVGSTSNESAKVMPPNGEEPINFDDGFRVGNVEVYPKRLTFVRDGKTERVEYKVMAVLVCLAKRADEVVRRDSIFAEVWPNLVVSDEVLSRDISILRSQLGDDAKEPRFIQTIPRIGYRLIAQVRPLHEAPHEGPASERPPDADSPAPLMPPPIPKYSAVRRWAIVGVALSAIAAVAIFMSQRLDSNKIAVLPFECLSASKDDLLLCDGLPDEIGHALSGVSGISVVAKTSSRTFRNSTDDIRKIGSQLNAGSLIEGSVRRDGDRLRITAQMINANTGLQGWSDSYDQRASDIFDTENKIARAILLHFTLNPDALATAGTQDFEAYTLFLRANQLLRKRGAAQLTRAVELLQEGVARDPKFARAYAGLAQAYTLLPSYSGASEKAGHKLALAAEAHAEALGEDPARSRAMRAYIDFRSREWQAAKSDFEVARSTNPNDADMLQWYSQFLASVGSMKRASEAAQAAVKSDPLSPAANQRAGVVSLWANDLDSAERYFTIASEDEVEGRGLPEAWIAFLLTQGRLDDARVVLVDTQRTRKQGTAWIEPALAAVAGTGPTSDAVDALTREFHDGKLGVPMYVGALFFIGDVDALYAALPEVIAGGEPFDVELFFSARGHAMRSDPRFVPLMTQLHLVEFWDAEGWPDACARTAQQIVCR